MRKVYKLQGILKKILKKRGALCQPPRLTDEENFRFKSKKAKITLETISFWQNISDTIFKFSPLLCMMKVCQ